VRLQQLRPNLPILHISGEPHDAAEDTGGHYLYKPFSPSELQQVVRTLLASRTRPQPRE
jgi:DNA-binding response OmpR family regulator